MDKSSTIKTGDVLLFSGNSPTGFLLKTFTSAEWNHSGIAVRFDKNKNISLTEEGDLYVLETNVGLRRDDICGDDIIGVGFSNAQWVFNKYNHVAVRKLHDIFRTKELGLLTLEFAKKFKGNKFPESTLPFIGVWLGIPLTEKDDSKDMFCSQLIAHYYLNCIGPQYTKLTINPITLTSLFGNNSPSTEEMFTPGHYTSTKTPNASIFSGKEELVYVSYGDLYYIIFEPFIIILTLMVLIWMVLPH